MPSPEIFDNLLKQMALRSQKGFLPADEARILYHYALQQAQLGPLLEVGSYCGKSSVFLGEACKPANSVLFAVDHHRGSEEHQPGEEYHDRELINPLSGCFDSYPAFAASLDFFQLWDWVVPVVASSQVAVRAWRTPLSMVFIDGGHSQAQALHDCLNWSEQVQPGGVLAVHDIYLTPQEGGQAPLLAMQNVLLQNKWQLERKLGSLVILRAARRQ